MTDEKFQSMPSITLDTADIEGRRHQRSAASHRDTDTTASRPLSSSMVKVGFVALTILLLASIAMIVYLSKQLKLAQKGLADTTHRVENLEGRLVSTDTTITQSEVLLAAKLNAMDAVSETNLSEVRKLWGFSTRQQKKLDEHDAELAKQKTALQELRPLAQQTAEKAAASEQLLTTLDAMTKETAQRMEMIQESGGALGNEIKTIRQKQEQMDVDVTKRVTALEDTAKSTDVFRRNTQDELRKLKEELARQEQSAGSKVYP